MNIKLNFVKLVNQFYMKNFFNFLCLGFLVLSCSNSQETGGVIVTDISVSSSQNSINWINPSDLLQTLDNVITFTLGEAKESQIETFRSFNGDSTEVMVSIRFKSDFEDTFSDPNPSNNSVTIQLINKRIAPSGVELKADGPGGTYDLITSVLAPGRNPIEVPDCNHSAFGDHIDEVFDTDLNTNVFRFHIHVTPDNDRCINFDRQRNEIKSYAPSPANLLGVEGETVEYNWKFKLPAGFQTSPNFTHLHQLKSVGGTLDAMPMYTLTARKSNPDRLELRYAESDTQVTVEQTPIAPFLNTWLEVTERITYGTAGTYSIEIKKVSDGSILLEYANSNIVNWRPNADFVRPKWGIYRSLINSQDLRDEQVLFADFRITEL